MAVAALMMSCALCACTENDPHPEYEKGQNGLYYRFFTQNEGETPKVGDLLDVYVCCMVNDTDVIISNSKELWLLSNPLFAGDIYEGLAMMHKGDSASFIVNIDSTYQYLFEQPASSVGYGSTDVLRFEVKVNDFCPLQEFHKNQANLKLANYLAKNNIVAEPTESGLYYVVTEPGNGEHPEVGKPVTMRYTGKLLDGTVFDSSVESGEPFQFVLGVGQVIAGWDEGVQLMTKGEKGVFYIPYYLGYGERDMGDIPPFSNLIFEVELVDF